VVTKEYRVRSYRGYCVQRNIGYGHTRDIVSKGLLGTVMQPILHHRNSEKDKRMAVI
jgi:hypothetical protein